MKIAVCIKQVPDTVDLRIDPESNTLIREGVESILNPLDEFALEAGLRLAEETGGQVTAFTMGPPQAVSVLEKAVAMGVDETVLVSDAEFAGSDTWATSLVLARAIAKAGPFDVILCGKQAVDGDTAQVGPGIAAHMQLPQITYVTRIEPAQGRLRVTRMLEHGSAVMDVSGPVVLTLLKEANEPRLPTLKGLIRTFTQKPCRITARDLDVSNAETGLAGSPTRVEQISVPGARRQHECLEGTPAECAAQLVQMLAEKGI